MKRKSFFSAFRRHRATMAQPQVLMRDERPSGTAMIYQSELDFVSRCILDFPRIETGGQLFGYWTASGVPVVLFAIGPGPRANHQVAFFNQDVEYLTKVGSMLVERYGLQHIGEWHSHHQLGLAHPSGHDAATMVNCIRRQNLGRFLLCIGNCTETTTSFNAYNFTQDAESDYLHAAWDVKEGISPFRAMIEKDRDLAEAIVNPKTMTPCLGELKRAQTVEIFERPVYADDYWLKDKRNNLVLKRIVDKLGEESDSGACAVQMDRAGLVHLVFTRKGREMRVVFPQGFPEIPPILLSDGVALERADVAWSRSNDIAGAFESYSKQFLHQGRTNDTKSL